MAIHGATNQNLKPVMHGAMETLTTKFKVEELSNTILSSKSSLVNNIEKKVVKK